VKSLGYLDLIQTKIQPFSWRRQPALLFLPYKGPKKQVFGLFSEAQLLVLRFVQLEMWQPYALPLIFALASPLTPLKCSDVYFI
jgi:hypothetical protein